MIIKMHADSCMDDENCWFMSPPLEGPGYVSTARATEAIERVMKGETGWQLDEIHWKRLMGPRQ